MKIVFFGSSHFAVPSLDRLVDSPHEIAAVVTQPDRKSGRHLKVSVTPVKAVAVSKNINTYQPESVSEEAFLEELRALNADLFVVVAFGQILPKDILEIPARYAVNLHPSLLPKYRGAAPVDWALINGETETGLSIIRMNEQMDAGDIILQRKVKIEKEDTSEGLNEKLSHLGAVLLHDAIKIIEADRATFKKQSKKSATLAPKLKKEDGLIDWKKTAAEINNLIKGTVPWPGAYMHAGGKKVNIWKAEVSLDEGKPGEVMKAGKELVIGTKKGSLRAIELQLEGKKRMSAAEFLRGFRDLKEGDILNA